MRRGVVASARRRTVPNKIYYTLADKFDTKDTAKWTWEAQPTVSGGAAHFPANGYGYGSSIVSVNAHDLVGSEFVFEVSAIPSTTTADGPFFTAELVEGATQDPADGYMKWVLYLSSPGAGTWSASYKKGASAVSLGSVAYGANTRWLKIKHDGSNVTWQTSADGSTWTIRATVSAATIGMTFGTLRAAFRAGADAANTGTFDVANVSGATASQSSPPPANTSAMPSPVRGIYHGVHLTWAYSTAALNKFNFLLHAFGHGNSSGTITHIDWSYTGMKADLDAMAANGRKVVLSIGGAGDGTTLTLSTAQACFDSLRGFIDTYGFKGVDFDLESAATYSADGLRTVAAKLKKHYGASFIVTCAPGPGNSTYRDFAATAPGWAHPTEGVIYSGTLCDAIMPQFYDWRASDASRQTSIYNEVNWLMSAGIEAWRIVIGGGRPWSSYLFYDPNYVHDGGHHPQVYVDAYNTLKGQGKSPRGLFLWNTGHDYNPNGYSTAGDVDNLADSGTPWRFRDLIEGIT